MKRRILTPAQALGTSIIIMVALLAALLISPADSAEPGDLIDLGTFAAEPGDLCTVVTDNNESVHPGNELIIETGNDQTRVPAVEDEPDTITATNIDAGGPITLTVVLGPDQTITSLEAVVTCEPPTTTSIVTTTTGSTTTSSTPVTTTTLPPTTVTTPTPCPDTGCTLTG